MSRLCFAKEIDELANADLLFSSLVDADVSSYSALQATDANIDLDLDLNDKLQSASYLAGRSTNFRAVRKRFLRAFSGQQNKRVEAARADLPVLDTSNLDFEAWNAKEMLCPRMKNSARCHKRLLKN